MYKIKQSKTRLKEIFAVLTDFTMRLLKFVERVQIQLTWVEANSAFPKHLPQNIAKSLNIELALLDFGSKYYLRLTNAIEKTLEIHRVLQENVHST